MNYGAGALLIAGGALLLVGIRGSQSATWKTLTGNTIKPGKAKGFTDGTNGASGDFAYVPFPSHSDPQTRNHPTSSTGGSNNYVTLAYNDAVANHIDPNYFVAQIKQESGFNPNARSGAGAEGIAQFMPATAAGLGVNPLDPVAALAAAAKLMGNYVRSYGSEAKALAAYNAGPGAVQNAVYLGGSNWEVYLPAETQNYIKTIMGGGSLPGAI